MPANSNKTLTKDSNPDEIPDMELTDEDIRDAMQHISGYLDISMEDFREIYHLAHRHAVQRLLANIRAGNLMRVGIEPLLPDMPLDAAARAHVRSGYRPMYHLITKAPAPPPFSATFPGRSPGPKKFPGC